MIVCKKPCIVEGWKDGRMEGRESRVKDCLQQSKNLGEWVEGWKEGKAGLRIAYSNQKSKRILCIL